MESNEIEETIEIREIENTSENNGTQGEETESTNLLSTSPSGEDVGGIVVQGSGGSIFQVTPAIVVHEVEPNRNGKPCRVDFDDDDDGKYKYMYSYLIQWLGGKGVIEIGLE